MKKISLVLLFFAISMLFTGCYTDNTKKHMELIEVKVYDKDNKEIKGTYQNYRFIDNKNVVKLSRTIVPVNSAAPVENYYCVDANENESYIVKFIFHSSVNFKLEKLYLNNNPESNSDDEEIECSNVEYIDGNYVVTLYIEKIEENLQYYHIIKWYNGNKTIHFNTKGSNTYNKGVCFILKNNNV